MKKVIIPHTRKLKVNKSQVGEDLVTKLRNRTDGTNNKDINTPGRALLYSERKDGVIPEGDPRTDKWDIMQAATDTVARAKLARRAAFDEQKARDMESAQRQAAESTQATNKGQ